MPLRFFEKGRHLFGVNTRKFSQATWPPLVRHASAPPTNARSIRPARIICNAMPIACVADEQALAMAREGPVQP